MDLAKKNEVNALFSFYGPLLTEKQQTYLHLYFEDDFSIIEIASSEQVSRQAVSDNMNRAVDLLYHYEELLALLAESTQRQQVEQELAAYVAAHYPKDQVLNQQLTKLFNQEIN
ncbi:DNA-binding protein [Leuconostocaceae bacterium ESL0958]|nr:DNA-binding protein [Leuconostocaceae bacterium ESL0958]